jgi:hypothetical protein
VTLIFIKSKLLHKLIIIKKSKREEEYLQLCML